MAKLQPCPKCGAQFDVSAFAPGAKFTCGACGTVVVAGAGAPAGRTPPPPPRSAAPPSRAVPAPASARRGPQYVPPERHAAPAAPSRGREAAGPEGGARRARRAGSREGAPRRAGLSPVVMAGIGAGVLAVALGAFLMMRKKEPASPGGGGTTVAGTTPSGTTPAGAPSGGGATAGMSEAPAPSPTKADTLADVEADWKKRSTHSGDELKAFLGRYQALGSAGADRAKAVATEIVSLADPQFRPARELLGHKEFVHEVPEAIAFRKYPYIRAVEEAAKLRWFEDADAYDLAMKAWEKTEAHARLMDEEKGDPTFRALDGARREIDRDPHFRDYNYEAIFASPYLICYSTDERMTEEELATLPRKERVQKLADLAKNREQYRQILAEKGKIYTQLYGEFLKRYADDVELKDLMSPFGGRPDYPITKRSFRDGCPLIIWIFSDRAAFDDYHVNVKKEGIDSGVAGYFSPVTSWVYLYDEGGDRDFEVNKNVHEGTHQLEHWFTKQKKEWGPVRRPQSFFGEGFAEYIGAVTMARDRKLTFHGINVPRIKQIRGLREQLRNANKPLYVYPLKDLVGFEGYHNVRAWAQEKGWTVDGLGIFYVQSWAFVYFLNEFQNGKYKKNFGTFLFDMLNHPRIDTSEYVPGYAFEHFKRAMNIRSEDDWKKLDKEFGDFYAKLIDMDLDKIGAPPPARDDWPGYVPADPVDPLALLAKHEKEGGKPPAPDGR